MALSTNKAYTYWQGAQEKSRQSPKRLRMKVGMNNTESFDCYSFSQVSVIWTSILNETYILALEEFVVLEGKNVCF